MIVKHYIINFFTLYRVLKKSVFLFVFCLLISNNLFSFTKQNKFNKEETPIEYRLSYYKEFKEATSFKEVLKADFKKMPNSKSFGVNNGVYWFRLSIDTDFENDLVAFIPTHNIDKVEVYHLINNSLNYLTSTGNSIYSDELLIDYEFPSFKIDSQTKKNAIFYLKVIFPKEANFPIKIIREKEFVDYVITKNIFNSFYYGTCLMIILLNIFLYIKTRDKVYLFYVLFLSSLIINFLLFDGSLIKLFRNNSIYYNLEFFIHISSEIWFLLFSIKFLNLDKRYPLFSKLLFIFPVVVIIIYACYLYTNHFILVAIANAIGIAALPLLWLFGVFHIKKIPYAIYYVLGYFLLIPFSVFFIIGYPSGLWNVDGDMAIVKIASWLDIFVFTYAISVRMKAKLEKKNFAFKQLQIYIDNAKSKLGEIEFNRDPYLTLLRENSLTTQPITAREMEILKFINKGFSNKKIADVFFISINTVKYHIRNIYNKVGVQSRKELEEKIKSFSEF